MKIKQGNAYEKLGRLIADYSKFLEDTNKEYFELSADEFKEKAASAKYKLICPEEYEMKEKTVRLYRYSDSVLMLKDSRQRPNQ